MQKTGSSNESLQYIVIYTALRKVFMIRTNFMIMNKISGIISPSIDMCVHNDLLKCF